MLQEPNAPPGYPRRFSPCALSSSNLSHANPFFSTSFLSTASLFLFCCSLRNGVFRRCSLFQLLHPLPKSSPPDLPATSREFYKTFHASLTTSASFPPTKQRILVWIEFLMEPTPPGPRPTLSTILLSLARDVRQFLCVEYELHRGIATTSSYIDSSGTRYHFKRNRWWEECVFKESRKSGNVYIFDIRNRKVVCCYSALVIFEKDTTYSHVTLEKNLVSLVVHFITANCNIGHSYCNIVVSTYTVHIYEYTRLFFWQKFCYLSCSFAIFLILNKIDSTNIQKSVS